MFFNISQKKGGGMKGVETKNNLNEVTLIPIDNYMNCFGGVSERRR